MRGVIRRDARDESPGIEFDGIHGSRECRCQVGVAFQILHKVEKRSRRTRSPIVRGRGGISFARIGRGSGTDRRSPPDLVRYRGECRGRDLRARFGISWTDFLPHQDDEQRCRRTQTEDEPGKVGHAVPRPATQRHGGEFPGKSRQSHGQTQGIPGEHLSPPPERNPARRVGGIQPREHETQPAVLVPDARSLEHLPEIEGHADDAPEFLPPPFLDEHRMASRYGETAVDRLVGAGTHG